MFENIVKFFKNLGKKDKSKESSDTAKERLHLVLVQDRANVSADFLELMKQEIIEVIKKYIDVDEKAIDVRLTNKTNDDGTVGAPALYANIPITTIKNDVRKTTSASNEKKAEEPENKEAEKVEDKKEVVEETKKNSTEKKENETKNTTNTRKKTTSANSTSKKKEIKKEATTTKTKTSAKSQAKENKEKVAKKEATKKIKETVKK